jgi:hypothetical protein
MAFAGEDERISADCLKYMAGKQINWNNAVTFCRGGVRVDCLELELDFWTARGRQDVAFNNAVSFCHTQAERSCVETVAALYINILIDAHNATLPPNDPGRRALLDPSASLQPTAIAQNDPALFKALDQVWTNAEHACRLVQKSSCINYVYRHYNPNGVQGSVAQNAINFAQNTCLGATRADCIDELVTAFGVSWENATNACRN